MSTFTEIVTELTSQGYKLTSQGWVKGGGMTEICKHCGKEIPEHTSDPGIARLTIYDPPEHAGLYHADCYVKLLAGEGGAA